MKKLLLFLALVNSFYTHAFEENPSDTSSIGRIGISAQVGTTGYGGSLNVRITKKIELTFGHSILDVSAKLATSFDGQKVDLTVTNKNSFTTFGCNLYPSKKSSFHLMVGAVLSASEFPIQAISKDSQSYQKIIFSPEQLGKLDFTFKGAEVMPLIGIGFGRAVPKRRIGFGLDLGAAYMGNLKCTITATKAFEPVATQQNENVLNNAFSDFKWYPFLNFKLNIKLF